MHVYGSIISALGTCALFAAFAGGFAAPAAALGMDESTIRGTVVDSASGAPLTGVVVRITGTGRSELTHDGGEFHLDHLAAGDHELVFSRIGYRTERRSVTVAENDTVTLRVPMVESAIEVADILVTGTLGGRGADDVFRPTGAISGMELSREMAGTVAETVENQAGVATVSMGPATARPVIRGLGGDRVLMLEDGERVGDVSGSSPDHAVAIDPLSAQRIEILRGPAALLYGSSALGGVVNVIREEIPTSVPDRLRGGATVNGRSADRTRAVEGSAEWGRRHFAVRAEASARGNGDLETPEGTLGNTDGRTYSAAVGGAWVSERARAGMSARLYDSGYGVPGGFLGAHEHGVRVDLERQAYRSEAEFDLDRSPVSSIELNAGFTRYHHVETEAGGVLGTEYGLRTASGEVLAHHDGLGPFDHGAGGARFEWRGNSYAGSLFTPSTDEYAAGGYLVEEIEPSPIGLEMGARYDWRRVSPESGDGEHDDSEHPRRSFGSVSGSIAALYEVAEDVRLGASIARAFRTPDSNELYSRGAHLAAYSEDVGNPDLRAETGLGLDFFLRARRDRVQAEVAVFQNRISDYIYLRNTGEISPRFPDLLVYQTTNGDAVLNGWEASAQWSLHPSVVIDGTASQVRGELETDDERDGEPLPMIPPLRANVELRYESGPYSLGVGWRGVAEQDRVAQFEEPTAGYALFRTSAGYRWTVGDQLHSLMLVAENLGDTEYRNHLSRVKSIMPEPGRNLNLFYRIMF